MFYGKEWKLFKLKPFTKNWWKWNRYVVLPAKDSWDVDNISLEYLEWDIKSTNQRNSTIDGELEYQEINHQEKIAELQEKVGTLEEENKSSHSRIAQLEDEKKALSETNVDYYKSILELENEFKRLTEPVQDDSRWDPKKMFDED
jgi:predicted  nucleic acid-binding Zn-ribbon protein